MPPTRDMSQNIEHCVRELSDIQNQVLHRTIGFVPVSALKRDIWTLNKSANLKSEFQIYLLGFSKLPEYSLILFKEIPLFTEL